MIQTAAGHQARRRFGRDEVIESVVISALRAST
jgi:hypothetical protein